MGSNETTDTTGITSAEALKKQASEIYRKQEINHVCPIPYIFSKKNPCMHRDCRDTASQRIIMKMTDSVSEYDVCQKHAELNQCQGIFPLKLSYEAVEK
ncbi:MAG: hypothetical protein WCO66_04460 [Candidatus Absconditabacteria bacterium]